MLALPQPSVVAGSCILAWQASSESCGSCVGMCEDQPEQSLAVSIPFPASILPASDQPTLSGHFTYQQVAHIGQGTFGKVIRAERLGAPQGFSSTVAIKLLPRGNAVRDFRTFIRREIEHQSSLQHPFIISIEEVFLTRTDVAIAMEYAEGGDLFQAMSHRPFHRLPEDQARWIFQQLLIGLDFCHKKGVANRDLKLENLLLDRKWDQARPLLKICDFGYSKHDINSPAKTGVGTPVYMAPEIILGGKHYDAKKADLWSCGVILFALVFGRYPFDTAQRHFPRKVVKGEYKLPEDVLVSDECRSLIQQMLVPEPNQRICIEEILTQPWFCVDLPPAALEMNNFYVAHQVELNEYMSKIDQIIAQSLDIGNNSEDLTDANVLVPKADYERG